MHTVLDRRWLDWSRIASSFLRFSPDPSSVSIESLHLTLSTSISFYRSATSLALLRLMRIYDRVHYLEKDNTGCVSAIRFFRHCYGSAEDAKVWYDQSNEVDGGNLNAGYIFDDSSRGGTILLSVQLQLGEIGCYSRPNANSVGMPI